MHNSLAIEAPPAPEWLVFPSALCKGNEGSSMHTLKIGVMALQPLCKKGIVAWMR